MFPPQRRGAFNYKIKLLNELDIINHSLSTTIDHPGPQKADSQITFSGRQHTDITGSADRTQ